LEKQDSYLLEYYRINCFAEDQDNEYLIGCKGNEGFHLTNYLKLDTVVSNLTTYPMNKVCFLASVSIWRDEAFFREDGIVPTRLFAPRANLVSFIIDPNHVGTLPVS
jgi:hypothetical protein